MAELGVHQSALLTDLALCINRYRLFSPGWSVCVMAKVQLSAEVRPLDRIAVTEELPTPSFDNPIVALMLGRADE